MKASDRYLAWMADICREAYIAERTTYEIKKDRKLASRRPPYEYRPGVRWDGGETEDGVEHKPIWPKIAAFMIKNNLEPRICIHRRFQMAKGSNPPWPTQIAVDTYLEVYQGIQEMRSEEDIRVSFELDKEYSRVAISGPRYQTPYGTPEQAWTAMLLDMSLDISNLMRYCLAHELKLFKVANMLENRALVQYMQAPKAYASIWGKHIPEGLTSAAASILDSLTIKRTKKDAE